LGIWFLLFLSNNGKEERWIWSLHNGFDEDDNGCNNVSNFLCMMTWRIRFLVCDIKAGMMLTSWNKFLRSLLLFLVVRSDHNEGLVRINLPLKSISVGFEFGRLRLVFLLLQWQKEERRHKKEDVQFCL
jgi:hypothetical protein